MIQAASAIHHTVLMAYPPQTNYGRVLPKTKIYERSRANTRLKDLFVKQVDQIVWQCKLAPETIRLPVSPGVPEIQIFTIHLKTPELHQDILRCIDGAVQYPIIFELMHDGRVQVTAAYKRPNEADTSRWVVSDYFVSDWAPNNTQRAPMPVTLNLGGLYEQLLHRLIPLPARPGEALADLVNRVTQAKAKQREIDKATARLAKEKQFNRKVAINADLRRLKAELDALCS